MNRIIQLFEHRKNGIKSIYFTAGYPELHNTQSVLETLQANGIDMVEIGIPFSDPMADGPVIQQATTQSLRSGMSLKLLFEQLQGTRRTVRIPLLLMGYLNPIIQYGFEHFCRSCAEVGVDGMIIPDLPFKDYLEDYKEIAEKYDLKVIMLITPETSEERIRLIDRHTNGFIYMVSSAAITGAQSNFGDAGQAYFKRIDRMELENPRLIGFGISNKETYETAAQNASGVIIGSRFVQLLGEKASPDEAIKQLLKDLGE